MCPDSLSPSCLSISAAGPLLLCILQSLESRGRKPVLRPLPALHAVGAHMALAPALVPPRLPRTQLLNPARAWSCRDLKWLSALVLEQDPVPPTTVSVCAHETAVLAFLDGQLVSGFYDRTA